VASPVLAECGMPVVCRVGLYPATDSTLISAVHGAQCHRSVVATA
jgi:hypothetical protein